MSLYNDLNEVLTPYANKIKEVNESLGVIKNNDHVLIEWTEGGWINTSGSNVNISSITASETFRYSITPASEGDVAVIYATGGASPRAWCFVDKSYNVLSVSAANATCSGTEVTAPANTAYAIIQDNSSTETDSYITCGIIEDVKAIENEMAGINTNLDVISNLTSKDVKSAIFTLLLNAAFVNENDRSTEYQLLRDWSLTTPSAKGGIFYHLDETVFDGTNGIITDLVFFDVDRDFTITVDFKVKQYYGRRVFGGILNNNNVVNGLALNGFGLNLNGTDHNFAHYGKHTGRVKMVFRHKKGSNALTIKSLSDYYNIVYDEQFAYTPNADSTSVLVVGRDLRNTIPFFGTIYELTFYAGVWSDTFATAYVKG